jgi:hypothetical protein
MEDVYRIIRTSMADYIERGIPDIRHALILDAYPGAGKTTNILAELWRLDMPFIYLAPDHDVIHENLTFHALEDYIGGFQHIMGRKHLCMVEQRRRDAFEYGMPIKPFCRSCEHREDGSCEYYQRRWSIEGRSPPSWAGVHAHITTYLPTYLFGDEDREGHLDDYDILVIEENPIKSLMRSESLTRNDLVFLERELNLYTFSNDEQRDVLLMLIDHLISKLGKTIDHGLIWRNFVDMWRNHDWLDFMEEFDAHIVMRIMNEGLQRAPRHVMQVLDSIFTTTTQERLPYHITSSIRDGIPRVSFNYFYGNALEGIPLHIVGLDGTANTTIWSRILRKDVHPIRITYSYENVYQLSEGNYPVSSWIYKNALRSTGKSLFNLVKLILGTRNGTTLLIGSKRLQKHIVPLLEMEGLDKKVEYAVYYNLRSKNFTYCDTVILLMKPSPPRHQLEIYTRLSGWDEEVWSAHYVDDEMLQALARVRSNMKEVKDAFGRDRIRDRVEIFVFSKHHIFTDEMVRPGSYWYSKKHEIEYFLKTGISSPITLTKNDLKMEANIKDSLQGFEEMSFKRLKEEHGMPRVLRRTIDRLVNRKELYYHGGKYGLV